MEGDAPATREQQQAQEPAAGARGQPGSGRISATALAQREQMSHGLMLQDGKCSVQKAPTLVMVWEQQGFQVKPTAATAKAVSALGHLPSTVTTRPGRGQGDALLQSSLPSSMDLHCWDTHHTRWLPFPRSSPMDANALYFHMKAKRKGFAGSLTRQNLLEERLF